MNTSTSKPTLTESMIIDAVKRYNASHGTNPNARSGDATPEFGHTETWTGVDKALRDGNRGLPGGSSLRQVIENSQKKDGDQSES